MTEPHMGFDGMHVDTLGPIQLPHHSDWTCKVCGHLVSGHRFDFDEVTRVATYTCFRDDTKATHDPDFCCDQTARHGYCRKMLFPPAGVWAT